MLCLPKYFSPYHRTKPLCCLWMPVPSCVLECGSLCLLGLYWWFPLSWSSCQVKNKQIKHFKHLLIRFQEGILQRGSGRSLSPIDYNQDFPFQSRTEWMCGDETELNALAAEPWDKTHHFMAVQLELEPDLACLEILQFYVPQDPAHLSSCGILGQVLRQEWSKKQWGGQIWGKTGGFLCFSSLSEGIYLNLPSFVQPCQAIAGPSLSPHLSNRAQELFSASNSLSHCSNLLPSLHYCMRKQSGLAAALEALTSGNVSGVFLWQNTADCQFENSHFWHQWLPVDFTFLQDTLKKIPDGSCCSDKWSDRSDDLTLGLCFCMTLCSPLFSLCECLWDLWPHEHNIHIHNSHNIHILVGIFPNSQCRL